MNTIFYSISISLFDSLSTTQQIIVFILLLTTAKPLRNSLSYLAGLMGAYFACGIAGYMTLGQLRDFLGKYFPSSANLPNIQYYQSEFIMGIIMIAIGVLVFPQEKTGGAKPHRKYDTFKTADNEQFVCLRYRYIYFGDIVPIFHTVPDRAWQIFDASPLACRAAGYVLLYNFGYALPMILIFFIYLIALHGVEDSHDTLHEKAKMLNLHLTTWTFAGFGLFSIVDAGSHFTIGHALIKGRYF